MLPSSPRCKFLQLGAWVLLLLSVDTWQTGARYWRVSWNWARPLFLFLKAIWRHLLLLLSLFFSLVLIWKHKVQSSSIWDFASFLYSSFPIQEKALISHMNFVWNFILLAVNFDLPWGYLPLSTTVRFRNCFTSWWEKWYIRVNVILYHWSTAGSREGCTVLKGRNSSSYLYIP